jgi:hypothetical protein
VKFVEKNSGSKSAASERGLPKFCYLNQIVKMEATVHENENRNPKTLFSWNFSNCTLDLSADWDVGPFILFACPSPNRRDESE